jgi:hypothetical protein
MKLIKPSDIVAVLAVSADNKRMIVELTNGERIIVPKKGR